MKITAVHAIAHSAPNPDMRGDGRNYCYVKIETDEGLWGWGEATCGSLTVVPMVEELGRAIIGLDPSAIELIWQHLYHWQHNIRGGIIHMAALSGIDIALWDLKGKTLGVPVHQLLGGAVRQRLWCYGRFDGATPEAAAEHARREVARGFTALKGDPFVSWGPYLEPAALKAAVAVVTAVRAAVGPDVELLIEAHGRLSLESATRFVEMVAPARPFFIEEPLVPEDLEGLAKLGARTSIPIATGERLLTKWAFAPLVERRLVDVVQPDPAHAGGITEVRKIAALAEAHHIAIQPHNPYGPINTLASAHLNAVFPNFLIMEVIKEPGMHDWFEQAVGRGFPKIAGGYCALPEGPGLGVDLDEDFIRALPPHPETHPSGYLRHAGLPSRQGHSWA
jgi:galactonate dehydratase